MVEYYGPLQENQRYCPKCGSIVTHSTKYDKNKAVKKEQQCRKCLAKEYKIRFKGENNPFYGKKLPRETVEKIAAQLRGRKQTGARLEASRRGMKIAKAAQQNKGCYQLWIDKFGKEIADQKEKEWKSKLSEASSGSKNPMYGKSPGKGAGNGWKCWYRNNHFRSLRELIFFISIIEPNKKKFRTGQNKELRIPYKDKNNKDRTYVADFLVDEKILIEIKPKELWNTEEVITKRVAAEIFCKENGLEYQIIDVDIKNNIPILREKYLNGEIEFDEKSALKFEKRVGIKNKILLTNNKEISDFFNKNTLIALSGNARSGKNLLQDIICEIISDNGLSSIKLALANKLKDDVFNFLKNNTGIDSYTEDNNEKKLIRPLLVEIGKLKREISKGTYYTKKLDSIINNNIDKIKIISDLRYFNDYEEDEYYWMRKNNGFLIYLERILPDEIHKIEPANIEEEKNNPELEKNCDLKISWPTTSDMKFLKQFVIDKIIEYQTKKNLKN